MCSLFEIDPKTGVGEDEPAEDDELSPNKCYVTGDGAGEIRGPLWAFHDMVAARGRPPLDDLVAFVVDDRIPPTFANLDPLVIEETRSKLATFWEGMAEIHQEALGRDPKRVERYWEVFDAIRKMAVGRDQFLAGKVVMKEEWFLHDFDLLFENRENWARLRVFDDSTAEAWTPTGLAGFDDERSAGTFIGEDHYGTLDTLRAMPEYAGKVPTKPPAAKSDDGVPFRYFGSW